MKIISKLFSLYVHVTTVMDSVIMETTFWINF